jgi:hypothetical protein
MPFFQYSSWEETMRMALFPYPQSGNPTPSPAQTQTFFTFFRTLFYEKSKMKPYYS